uniref:Phosphodiesterase 4B cAMP-specific isoform C n=1 Tax=Homo sapiens TaxID=9606 RepID=X5DPA9_HUMAN|nr:phosphodiesterase 4B cAMP-specific isoform C [Homo sapiens]
MKKSRSVMTVMADDL